VESAQAQQSLQITKDADSVWIRAGDSPILQYQYGNVPFKPYVKELCTPGGMNFLLDAPSDHLHHHALMFAVAVDGVNFWEETPTAGHEVHDGFDDMWTDETERGAFAGFTERIRWAGAKDQPELLLEDRRIGVFRVPQLNATMMLWESHLSVPPTRKSVTLSGSHYFGLGARFVRAMDGGEFFNADDKEGTVFRGEERLVQSDWCAYTATMDGKPVTVAMWAYPTNPRHPTTWFMMAKPFAYLSATLNLHEKPLTLYAGKHYLLSYAIVAWDGTVDKGRVDQAYQWSLGDWSEASESMKGAEQNEKPK
jgi:hypothetical protein